MFGSRCRLDGIVSLSMIVGLISAFVIPQPFQPSFAEETGSLKVRVNHTDGSLASPDDFFAVSEGEERQGYFSLNDADGNIINVFPTCNESSGSCEIDGLAAGDYTATILLGGGTLIVGAEPAEYSEDVTIEGGMLTEVVITVEYGRLEINVTHLDDQELDSAEYVSEFGFVEGYYSIYNGDGDLVADAPSCNLDGESCSLVIASGIYTATIVSPASLTPYSVVIEIVDNSVTTDTIEVDIGAFEVRVLDGDGELAGLSSFSLPIGYNELGWFAAYDAEGYLIVEAESCNVSNSCTYPFDAGVYQISIRRLPAHFILSCVFEITDNNVTPVVLYLDPPGCNQIPADSGSENEDGVPTGGNSNGDSNSSSGSNTPTGAPINPSLLSSLLQERTVSIVSNSHYIDRQGFYHVVGEVMNTQTIAANKIVITSVFYSNASDALAVKRTQTLVDVLKPGERAPFEIVIPGVAISNKIGSYELFAVFKNTTSTFSPGFLGLNITANHYSNDTGLYHVQGTVYNYARSETSFVRVIVSAYDRDGIIVHVAQEYVTSLLPEISSASFDLAFMPVNASDIASISAIVQSREYGMIPVGKLSTASPTLDVTYASGIISLNGTVPSVSPESRFGIVYITWPDGYHNDKEVVAISDQGYFEKTIVFYAPIELKGQTFTAKIVYGDNFTEKDFVFT